MALRLNYKPEKGVWWQAPVVLAGLIAGAKLKLDIGIIPFTLQTFSLFITCLYFSRQANLLGTFLYMLAGLYMPVFSGYIYGKTFYYGATAGFIYGFPFAVILVSGNKKNFNDWFSVFSWLLMGHALILIFGTGWAILYSKIQYQSAMDSYFWGILPGAVIKSLAVSLIYWLVKRMNKNPKAEDV